MAMIMVVGPRQKKRVDDDDDDGGTIRGRVGTILRNSSSSGGDGVASHPQHPCRKDSHPPTLWGVPTALSLPRNHHDGRLCLYVCISVCIFVCLSVCCSYSFSNLSSYLLVLLLGFIIVRTLAFSGQLPWQIYLYSIYNVYRVCSSSSTFPACLLACLLAGEIAIILVWILKQY